MGLFGLRTPLASVKYPILSSGVQKKAAQLLGLKPTMLNDMIKPYKISLERKESSSTR